MRVLLIDCYEDTKSKEFKAFARLLKGWFQDAAMRAAVGHVDIIPRRLNNLHDYAIDWEFDMLDQNGKNICKRFDCVSLIVVAGDMKITPWHMGSSQLITLLWMAELCKKPTLCCGSGAFAAVYSAAGQGTKFNILNQPHGESVEKLTHFPRYSRAVGQFPGMWMDNETGDLYKFNTQFQTWIPASNMGMHRCAMRGEPTPARFRPAVKHFASADHALRAASHPEASGDHEWVAYVRSKFVEHFALKDISTTSFVCSLIPDWYLNDEGSLPCNGMCIAADTELGPAILVRELSVYITAKVGDDLHQADVRQICRSYVNHIVTEVASRDDGHLGDSVYAFLFGDGGGVGGTYDSIKHKKVLAPPLSQQQVKSFIPRGPLRVDPPIVTMFIEEPPEEVTPLREAGGNEVGGVAQTKLKFATTAPVKARAAMDREEMNGSIPSPTGSVIAPPPISPRKQGGPAVLVREPHKNRKKRLAKFLKSVGHKSMLKLNTKVAAETARLDPYGVDNAVPDSARDIFQGLRMDTNNVFNRRPVKVGSTDSGLPLLSPIQHQNSNHSPDLDERDARDDISDHGIDIFESQMDDVQHLSRPESRTNARPQSAHERSSYTDLQGNPSEKNGRAIVTRGSSIVEGAMATNCLPIRRPQTAGKMPSSVEYITRQSSKPFNNKQKFDELEEQDRTRPVNDYHGMFKGGHLSAFEKEQKEYRESKGKFLHGNFVRHFDRASSMPLREEGAIRPHGAYPKNAPNSMHLKPDDWHHIRTEDEKKAVAPNKWKPVTKHNSFMKNSFNY